MWTNPKIDWRDTDYFNAIDYNRIKNNLIYLKELANKLYDEFEISEVGKDKTYSDYFYADEINLLEQNFDVINNKSIQNDYGKTSTYYANGKMINYIELNHLEQGILDLYDKMTNQQRGKRNFKFNFGKRGGIE